MKQKKKEDLDIRLLIQKAFEKVYNESRKTSVNAKVVYLSEKINLGNTERTLTRYHKKYLENNDSKIGRPREDILNAISQYLGYKDFLDFNLKEFPELQSEIEAKTESISELKSNGSSKWKKIVLGLGGGVLLGGTALFSWQKINPEKQCMYWKKDHYERVVCDTLVDSTNKLIPLNERELNFFKKMTVSDTTTFFKNGKAVVWYCKNKGQVEFFSESGEHPENGKFLKPVTAYIVNKYVLKR